jgi:hypothetical protein
LQISLQHQLQHPSVVRIFGIIKGAEGSHSIDILGKTYYYPGIVMRELISIYSIPFLCISSRLHCRTMRQQRLEQAV